jgi:glycosyltransferase involved in cell wall biosynthesis
MKVLVGIPTYNNRASGYSIKDTLAGLANQEEKGFSVLVVAKPCAGDDTLELVDSYKDEIDLEVLVQRTGYVEEAMNAILEGSKRYDLLLTIDDDAVPNPRRIKQYIGLFERFPNLGAITGAVDPPTFDMGYHQRIRSLLLLDRPLIPALDRYCGYFSDIGLFEFPLRYPGSLVIYSLGLRGVNMGVLCFLLRDFRLPCVSLRGLGYEWLTGLNVVKQGRDCAVLRKGCDVLHRERTSLSRPTTKEGIYGYWLEVNLIPYAVSLQSQVNLAKLRSYKEAVRMYSRLVPRTVTKAWSRGLDIAWAGIEEGWNPERVRRAVIESVQAFGSCRP